MKVRVVGSGPAGLMAADVLASGGAHVTIIDHHAGPARKFLLAGRGGLNLTHSEPLEDLLNRYGAAKPYLEPMIRAFPPDALRAWCAELGISTFVGSSGRVFPAGMRTSPLLRAWLRRLSGLGVELKSAEAWQGFDDVPTILALGGASWPELGSDAKWVAVFDEASIRVEPFQPSNVRLAVDWPAAFVDRYKGQPIKNVAVSAAGQSARGEIMIAANGIEGGAIYALSAAMRKSGVTDVLVDLKPDLSAEVVAQRLAKPRGKASLSNFLRKALNLSPVAIALMRAVGADNPKCVSVKTQGPVGITRAISSAGGVAWSEVDEGLALFKRPNTFVAGEMLDWDAPTGGYLLQASLASGRWAAQHCLLMLQAKQG